MEAENNPLEHLSKIPTHDFAQDLGPHACLPRCFYHHVLRCQPDYEGVRDFIASHSRCVLSNPIEDLKENTHLWRDGFGGFADDAFNLDTYTADHFDLCLDLKYRQAVKTRKAFRLFFQQRNTGGGRRPSREGFPAFWAGVEHVAGLTPRELVSREQHPAALISLLHLGLQLPYVSSQLAFLEHPGSDTPEEK